jgi:hypothetical protein
MSWLMPALVVALALLGPLFGADTRDGFSWKRRRFPADTPRAAHPGPPPQNNR